MPIPLSASLWRGGLSRVLIFNPSHLKPYTGSLNNVLFMATNGDRNKDRAAYDGFAATNISIVGSPLDSLASRNVTPDGKDCDIVSSVGSINVKEQAINWTKAPPYDLLSAAVHAATTSPLSLISPAHLLKLRGTSEFAFRTLESTALGLNVKIFSSNIGQVYTVRLPIDAESNKVVHPLQTWWEYFLQCGMHDTNPVQTTEIEVPIRQDGHFPTGNVTDSFHIGERVLNATIVQLDEPVILLDAPSLIASSSKVNQNKYLNLDDKNLMKNETLVEALQQFRNIIPLLPLRSTDSGNIWICLVNGMSWDGYNTLHNYVCDCQAEITTLPLRVPTSLSEPLETYTSLPKPILDALGLTFGIEGTTTNQAWCQQHPNLSFPSRDLVPLSAAAPDGVYFVAGHYGMTTEGRRAHTLVYPSSSREIMRGEIMIPDRVFDEYSTT